MGQVLRCCFCSTSQTRELSNELSVSSTSGFSEKSVLSEPPPPHPNSSSQIRRIQSLRQQSSQTSLNIQIVNLNASTCNPKLECFIIPSFGEDLPGNVAVKLKMSDKMASEFLKGIEKDFDIIQQLIEDDDNKQLRVVQFMCHFSQKKVEEFKKAIGDAMKNIKLKRTPTQKGCKYNT